MDTKLPMLLAASSVTAIITVLNIVIRTVTINLITWIGYDTHSELVTAITNAVFLAQFLNTAIVVLLVYANFTEFGGDGKSFFDGPFYDYQPGWYAVVGYRIVQTMIINALLPILFESLPIFTSWLFQRVD